MITSNSFSSASPSLDAAATSPGRVGHCRRRTHRARQLCLAGLTVVLLAATAGCSGSVSIGSPPADSDSSAQPAETTSPSGGPADQQPRDDLDDEQPVAWTSYEDVGERQVRVRLTVGNPSCYGVRAEVRESAAAVTIATFSGSVPDGPDVCAAIAAETSLLVSLDAPVGQRKVTQP
jgi:hypothetical protein